MRKILLVFIFIIILGFMTSCSGNTHVAYQPPFLPVRLVVNDNGLVSVEGDLSLATPVGIFSIGADYSLNKDKEHIFVIIRDRKINFDQIFKIQNSGDELVAVFNGKTVVQITDQQILIDVTDGNIETIEFKQADPALPTASTNPLTKAFSEKTWFVGEYNFFITRWAYDDSTIGKWYGIGFIWFLIRFLVSIVGLIIDIVIMYLLLLADIILAVGLFLGVVLGSTIANIFYAILALFFIGVLVLSIWQKESIYLLAVIFFPVTIIIYLLERR